MVRKAYESQAQMTAATSVQPILKSLTHGILKMNRSRECVKYSIWGTFISYTMICKIIEKQLMLLCYHEGKFNTKNDADTSYRYEFESFESIFRLHSSSYLSHITKFETN